MKLRKLSFKNFKSYSNVMTEISFDGDSSLNLITGDNGTGKTSIAECVTYLLYGKLEDFTSSDIPNRINKNFYGKIELDCDGHNLVIERGLNPGLFNVQVDNITIDTAGKQNVQNMIEETYFHIPYAVFHNILVLEVGEVKSLLDMNASDKRNIIDRICGFTIYNNYNKLAKELNKDIESKIYDNSSSIRTMMNSIEQYEQQINEINKNTSSQEEIDELKNKIEEVKKIKYDNDEKLKKIRLAGDKIKNLNYQKNTEYNRLKDKIKYIDDQIKLIDSGKCPTCGQTLDTEDFHKKKEELIQEKSEYIKQMNDIVKFINDSKNKINLLNTKEQEIQINNSQMHLADIQSDFKYKSALKEKSTKPIEELKNKINTGLQKLYEEKKVLDDEKGVMDFILSMFSDDGIKKFISSKYIPTINNLISSMMKYMNLNYTVTFDNGFNATILQNGVKVKYSTLSKGEKRRVDFATVISFIRFLKIQFGELNLLFLDEIFSNVDINGVNDMIEILKTLCSDLNLNIYLIHHAKVDNIMFDNILKTTKVDGFSKIEYI